MIKPRKILRGFSFHVSCAGEFYIQEGGADMYQAGLVLEGGSTRGIFTAGVLDFLLEKNVEFSYIIGVSARSCNAVDFVSKQFDRTRHCLMPEKENNYMTPKSILKKRSIFDMDMIFDKYPNGIYPFDFDTYFASDSICEIVTTNARTGEAEYFTEDNDRERLMQICRASCSMPMVTPMVRLGEDMYVDGGVADSIPLEHTMKKGYDKIFVVLTRNKGYRKAASPRVDKIWHRYFRKYPKLALALEMRYVLYNRQMDLVDRLEEEGKIFVIRPEIKTISRTERNREKLMEFYRHGYIQMMKQYDGLIQYLEK